MGLGDMKGLVDPDLLDGLVEMRHRLHREPELAFEVDQTASVVASELDRHGFDVITGVGGSGVVASLRLGRSDRGIGLRADLDALPIDEAGDPPYRSRSSGAFHGCGHDGHSTMLVGAGRLLAERASFEGVVHLIFQPDEENGRGALAMIDDGLFERFPMDSVYGLHNLPGLDLGRFALQPGPMAAFEENFEITLEGRGGHASMPELTADPMVAGAEMITALQTIVARALPPNEHTVVSVTEFITDGARNIIPTNAVIRGDTRGFTEDVSRAIQSRMGQIVEGVARAHGIEADLDYRRGFEAVINTQEETAVAAQAAREVTGARVDPSFGRVGFSEDFGQMLDRSRGCMVLMGNGVSGSAGSQLHNPYYDFNDGAIPYGVEYWVRLVEHVLTPHL